MSIQVFRQILFKHATQSPKSDRQTDGQENTPMHGHTHTRTHTPVILFDIHVLTQSHYIDMSIWLAQALYWHRHLHARSPQSYLYKTHCNPITLTHATQSPGHHTVTWWGTQIQGNIHSWHQGVCPSTSIFTCTRDSHGRSQYAYWMTMNSSLWVDRKTTSSVRVNSHQHDTHTVYAYAYAYI